MSLSPFIHIDTALIAQEASIDIQNMLAGKPKDVIAMRNLALILNDFVGADTKDDAERPPMDPIALGILHTAMTEAGIVNSTVRELLTDAEEIVKILSSNDPIVEVPRWIIGQMRDFCSGLSKAITVECANRRNLNARTRRW